MTRLLICNTNIAKIIRNLHNYVNLAFFELINQIYYYENSFRVELRMFFLSNTRREVADLVREEGRAAPVREYNNLLSSLGSAVNLLIYRDAIPEFHSEGSFASLEFNKLLRWSEKDWSKLYKRLSTDDWIIVFVARGGFMLLDTIENKIDDFTWTYIKPKLDEVKPHEDSSVYDEYTDPALEEKLAEFNGQDLKVLYVEDVILDDYESNVDYVQEMFTSLAEDHNINIVDHAILCLLTRTTQVSGTPVYGTLISYNGGILTDRGNDSQEGFDYYDFSEIKEYIDDH